MTTRERRQMADLLQDAYERFNTKKHEHITDIQRDMSLRKADAGDIATLDACLTGTGVGGVEAMAQGARVVDAVERDLKRAGKMRGVKRGDLRALVFSVWCDGLGAGLHVDRSDAA